MLFLLKYDKVHLHIFAKIHGKLLGSFLRYKKNAYKNYNVRHTFLSVTWVSEVPGPSSKVE